MAVTASSAELDYFSLCPRAGSCSGMAAAATLSSPPPQPQPTPPSVSPQSPMALAVRRMISPAASSKPTAVSLSQSAIPSMAPTGTQSPMVLPVLLPPGPSPASKPSVSRSHQPLQSQSPPASCPCPTSLNKRPEHNYRLHPQYACGRDSIPELRLPARAKKSVASIPSTATTPTTATPTTTTPTTATPTTTATTSSSSSCSEDTPAPKMMGALARRRRLGNTLGLCPMPRSDKSESDLVDQKFFYTLRQNLDLRASAEQNAASARLPDMQRPFGLLLPSGAVVFRIPRRRTGLGSKLDSNSIWQALPPWLVAAASGEDGLTAIIRRFARISRREEHRLRAAIKAGVAGPIPAPPRSAPGRKTTCPAHDVGFSAGPLVEITGFELGTKNRYKNVWPYHHSRVKLPIGRIGASAAAGSNPRLADYINANHVSFGCCSGRQYIATQAPTLDSMPDFWTMVWGNNVRVLMMLTAEVEQGVRKSEPYWMPGMYGNIEIVDGGETVVSLKRADIDALVRSGHVSSIQFSHPFSCVPRAEKDSNAPLPTGYFDIPLAETAEHACRDEGLSPNSIDAPVSDPIAIVRRVVLRFRGISRPVFQVQFSAWPDFGTPARASDIVSLARLCRVLESFASTGAGLDMSSPPPSHDSNNNNNDPVLVHCAAGCGRSGTFCTVDTALDVLLDGRVVESGMSETKPSSVAVSGNWNALPVPFDPVADAPAELDPDDRTKPVWTADLIEAIAEVFRTQRMNMIQSFRQYELCYEGVLDALYHELV